MAPRKPLRHDPSRTSGRQAESAHHKRTEERRSGRTTVACMIAQHSHSTTHRSMQHTRALCRLALRPRCAPAGSLTCASRSCDVPGQRPRLRSIHVISTTSPDDRSLSNGECFVALLGAHHRHRDSQDCTTRGVECQRAEATPIPAHWLRSHRSLLHCRARPTVPSARALSTGDRRDEPLAGGTRTRRSAQVQSRGRQRV